jgi:hypothetical protein
MNAIRVLMQDDNDGEERKTMSWRLISGLIV